MDVNEPSARYLANNPPMRTEVGDIPFDWNVTTLGHIATVTAGSTPSRKVPGYWGGHIPWVTTAQIDFNTVLDSTESITELGLRNSAAKLLRPGTLLMALYGQGTTRGKVAILGLEATTNQACAAIVLAPMVSRGFVFHYLASQYERIRKLSNAGSQENLSGGIVRSILIPLPPSLAEQEAIAEALNDADALVNSLGHLLAKKRQIKQGAMQELLTGHRRLQGFSESWSFRALRDMGTFLKGRGITRDQALSGHIPCVRYGEIYTTHHDCIRVFHSWISAEVAASATLLKKGDLLFAGSGETKAEIGKCVAFVDDFPAYAGGDIVILRPRGMDSIFLGYALNSPAVAQQKASRGQGDAVVHISATALADIALPIPPLAEQTAIATTLSDMDAEITSLEARLAKAHALKQGMAQTLLTGRIRLV